MKVFYTFSLASFLVSIKCVLTDAVLMPDQHVQKELKYTDNEQTH